MWELRNDVRLECLKRLANFEHFVFYRERPQGLKDIKISNFS
jgi:hypothetical protein